MSTKTQRPTWLVIVRFGAIVAAIGLLVGLLAYAGIYALADIAPWIIGAGLVIAVGGFVYRLSR
jgi:hypothetical protein